ncbi:MAG: Hsp20/alpha crystallin family protein [Candidatus Zipacnadales bacterium]
MMRMLWSPTHDLLQLHARLGRALGDPRVRRWNNSEYRGKRTMPPLDFSETDESYIIRMDLPGVQKEAIQINVGEGSLEITGETPPVDEDKKRLRRSERFHGSFRRLVPLPRQADTEAVQARLNDGVLALTIAKRAPHRERRIEIE